MITNIFLDQLQTQNATEVALYKGTTNISAGDIWAKSYGIALELQEKGMKKGDKAVLACEPGPDFLCIIFATMLLEVQVAIIDPEMGRDNYKAKLQQFQPQWAFIDYRLLLLQEHPIIRWLYFKKEKKGLYFPPTRGLKTIATGGWMPIIQKHLSLNRLFKNIKPSPKSPQLAPAQPFDYIVTYTSGTIDVPKGVLHSIESLSNSITLITSLLGDTKTQRLATHLPHFMLIGVCSGLPIHIWDYKSSALAKIEFIKKHQITTLFGPPADYLDLMAVCQTMNLQLPNCLTHVLLGSAPVHVPFLEKLIAFLPKHTRITCLYGMTENLVVATVDGRLKAKETTKGDLLGTPAPNVEIKIAEDGEIMVKSPQLFSRYLHESERKTWHATGDLGYLDEGGRIVLSGRKKEMIIRRNFNLYPALYEPTIKKIKGIQEAVLIGVYDENLADERVFLVVEGDENLIEKEIRQQISAGRYSIDAEALPDEIVLMPIPRSGRQRKVDRKTLQDILKR